MHHATNRINTNVITFLQLFRSGNKACCKTTWKKKNNTPTQMKRCVLWMRAMHQNSTTSIFLSACSCKHPLVRGFLTDIRHTVEHSTARLTELALVPVWRVGAARSRSAAGSPPRPPRTPRLGWTTTPSWLCSPCWPPGSSRPWHRFIYFM